MHLPNRRAREGQQAWSQGVSGSRNARAAARTNETGFLRVRTSASTSWNRSALATPLKPDSLARHLGTHLVMPLMT